MGLPRSQPEEHERADAFCLVSLLATENSKVVAERTQIPPQDENQWRCTCTHHTRSEVRRKWGRDNVAAEVEKLRAEVAIRRQGSISRIDGPRCKVFFV
jgi:hypothetical protein